MGQDNKHGNGRSYEDCLEVWWWWWWWLLLLFCFYGDLKLALRISAVSMPRHTVCKNKWLRNARIGRQAFLLYASLIFNLLYIYIVLK